MTSIWSLSRDARRPRHYAYAALHADEAELAATRPTNVVIEGFAGLAPRLGRRPDAAHAGGGLLNVVADGKGRQRRAQGSVTRSQPSLVALDLNVCACVGYLVG